MVGAALHGVQNICCLTGDDVTAGDEPEARRVFDLDGPQLVRVATLMGRGRYLSGPLDDPAPHLFVGAVENPDGAPARLPRRARAKKIAAGARFLQLQIYYQPEQLEAFVAACSRSGVARTSGHPADHLPHAGARALTFMDANVPGISVPARTIAAGRRQRRPGRGVLPARCASWPSTRSRCPASPGCTSPTSATTTAFAD